MRRSTFTLLLLASACARTGLTDFGRDDSGGDAGAGGSSASGGSAPNGGSTQTGGSAGSPDECRTALDCPVADRCAPPTCRLDGNGSNARLRCIAEPLECDDGNPCSFDSCEPSLGACVYEFPLDGDGDGFIGESPPNAPPACGGDDCDDTRFDIFPGAGETCDGFDNDCNDAIDDGFDYSFVRVQPTPISPLERGRATHGGLVWNGENFAASYNTTSGHKQSYFKLINGVGQDASAEVEVSQINADAFSGPIEWSGSSFFSVFSDARQGGNYEVYAARFGLDGQKVQADLRLSDAPDFSLNPAVVWTGEHYVVAWDDRRDRANGGGPQIFARRFSVQGQPIGDEVLVSPLGEWSEFPALAVGARRLGLAYVSLGFDGDSRARFRTLDFELGGMSEAIELPVSRYANNPSIAFAGGSFMVAWAPTLDESLPAGAVHVAVVDEAGGEPRGGHPVTFGFSFVRTPSLVSLGDRALLVFSAAGADGAYELWTQVVPVSLGSPVPGARITFTEAMSLFPYAARGPDGTVGIVFDEEDETPPTSRRPHFMGVGCGLPVDELPLD